MRTEIGKLTVITSLTLDGVMQAPGRPDEDTRGGFQHGGWALPYNDPVMGKVAAEGMAGGGAILTLTKNDLVDRYILLIHPLVLGSGRRLFADGTPLSKFKVVDTRTTTTGVVIATYQPG